MTLDHKNARHTFQSISLNVECDFFFLCVCILFFSPLLILMTELDSDCCVSNVILANFGACGHPSVNTKSFLFTAGFYLSCGLTQDRCMCSLKKKTLWNPFDKIRTVCLLQQQLTFKSAVIRENVTFHFTFPFQCAKPCPSFHSSVCI